MNVRAIVETAIYVADLDETASFYQGVLGLPVLAREPGRHVFFRVGDNDVLLAFDANATRKGDVLPPHGATGPGHFALGIEAQEFDAWRQKLQGAAIVIEKEMVWPNGGRSLYFRDPAGNSVELITPGVWGLPGGW